MARCSAVLDFGLEGLPCGDGGACLEGYLCKEGVCAVAPPDAGPGPVPCNGACLAGQTCRDEQCIWECAIRKTCPPGMFCNSTSVCENVAGAEMGASCTTNGDCGSGLECLRSATAIGVCAAPSVVLDGGANNCPALGGIARKFDPGPGPSIFVCLPSSFPHCSKQSDCDPLGLQCTFWSFVGGAKVGACAWSLDGGAGPDESCDGKTCKNGLCIPGGHGGTKYCSEPCKVETDCTADLEHQCLVGALSGQPPAVTFCQRPQGTLMCECSTPDSINDIACGADAPLCVQSGSWTRCRAPCAVATDCRSGDACSDGLCVEGDLSLPEVPDGGC